MVLENSVSSRRKPLSPCIRHTFSCLLVVSCVFFLWFAFSLAHPHSQLVTFNLFANPASFDSWSLDEHPSTNRRGALLESDTPNAIAATAEDLSEISTQPPLAIDPDMSNSLTAILPVTPNSLPRLDAILEPFLNAGPNLREVIVTCPESIMLEARRRVLRAVNVFEEYHHPDFSLRSWTGDVDSSMAVIREASQVTTGWMLLLDEDGLQQVGNSTRAMLLDPEMASFLVDLDGHGSSELNVSCAAISNLSDLAPYFPPLIIPTVLFPADVAASHLTGSVWPSLAGQLSKSFAENVSGNVWSMPWSPGCSSLADVVPFVLGQTRDLDVAQSPLENDVASILINAPPEFTPTTSSERPGGVFVLLLPLIEDLEHLSALLCNLQGKGYSVEILLTDDSTNDEVANHQPLLCSPSDRRKRQLFASAQCNLPHDVIPDPSSRCRGIFIPEWLDTLTFAPDVIISLSEDPFTPGLHSDKIVNASRIRLPRADLAYCLWMSTMSIVEWKNWNTPRIDASIITKDRPRSLKRLLSSLSKGIFFGDTVNLRMNLEQSSNHETIQIAENLVWEHGDVFVHHRVIHAGLLTAVVESWYPHSNDTYCLLLEDDVELSPLFYAWIKMSVLRYRYGEQANRSPQLFGISLYQQKNIELRLEGRQPFSANSLFSSSGFPSTIPYLSQIPCSWGAVYFPSHWREFHEYLSWRLSESTLKITETIVPNVRSNKWTRSWKKYFIELTYLRSYVMLYPNYDGFISLSTNHLEVGSHVKGRSETQKEQFLLPLMKLPGSDDSMNVGLLDLPGGSLPDWDALPTLNLTGSLTSLEMLVDMGLRRQMELTIRPGNTSTLQDVWGFPCIHDDMRCRENLDV